MRVIQDLYHLSWRDSPILSAANLLRRTSLLSEDFEHSQDFQGIRVINPLRMSPAELLGRRTNPEAWVLST